MQTEHKKQWLIGGAIATLVIVIAVTLCFALGGDNRLRGTWALDEVTSYEFGGGGKGTMRLSSSEYPFTYRVDGDTVTIDFVSEAAADRDYTYSVKGDTLTLTSGSQQYTMTKQK